MEEEACIAERLDQARAVSQAHAKSAKLAVRLVEGARKRKASGIDAFLQQFGLATEEGIALMCLAEALLRVPDAQTADALIRTRSAISTGANISAKAARPSSTPLPSR